MIFPRKPSTAPNGITKSVATSYTMLPWATSTQKTRKFYLVSLPPLKTHSRDLWFALLKTVLTDRKFAEVGRYHDPRLQ